MRLVIPGVSVQLSRLLTQLLSEIDILRIKIKLEMNKNEVVSKIL